MFVCVCTLKKPLYSTKGQDCAKWNNNRPGAREEGWGRLGLTVGGSDCNLSPLFQHRAAGERRCWGLCSRYGPIEALLSITELLHVFMELGTPRKKVLFFMCSLVFLVTTPPQQLLLRLNKKNLCQINLDSLFLRTYWSQCNTLPI